MVEFLIKLEICQMSCSGNWKWHSICLYMTRIIIFFEVSGLVGPLDDSLEPCENSNIKFLQNGLSVAVFGIPYWKYIKFLIGIKHFDP